jgi:hypothetical protein
MLLLVVVQDLLWPYLWRVLTPAAGAHALNIHWIVKANCHQW